MKTIKITARTTGPRGTYWTVLVDGAQYRLTHEKGKHVRIAYKPRGENVGFHWFGSVYGPDGQRVYRARVNKSTGPYRMLLNAGVIEHVDHPQLGVRPGRGWE